MAAPDVRTAPPGAVLAVSDARTAEYLSTIPLKYQTLQARALAGTLAPRQAIKARCQQCSNFQRAEITHCTVCTCALWALRPYQHADETEEAAPEKANAPE
jgi:hypothetical protein